MSCSTRRGVSRGSALDFDEGIATLIASYGVIAQVTSGFDLFCLPLVRCPTTTTSSQSREVWCFWQKAESRTYSDRTGDCAETLSRLILPLS